MLKKRKVPTSTSGVFDRVKELKNKNEDIWIERNDPYKAFVTKVGENTITYSSAEYKDQDIVGDINSGQTLQRVDVDRYYELGENEDGAPLLKRKSTAGGGKTRAPGKRVISGRARVVYVGPRGGEYIKKDGKFVRI